MGAPARSTGGRASRGALIFLGLATTLAIIDSTIVNVALPSISADIGLSLTAAEWVVSGYGLMLASLLITFGRLADRIGGGPRSAGGIGAGGLVRLAVRVPDQPAHRAGRRARRAADHPAGSGSGEIRRAGSDRPGAVVRRAGGADLRSRRGAESRLVLADGRRNARSDRLGRRRGGQRRIRLAGRRRPRARLVRAGGAGAGGGRQPGG